MALPPTYSFTVGWNSVGVTTFSDTVTSISADSYFAAISWNSAVGYSPASEEFITLLPNTGANLIVGQGYYVFVTQDGTLAP